MTTASNAILTNSINAITADTGTLSIGASQTDGILNIGTNIGRTSTGAINIGDTANLGKINIETINAGVTNADPAVSIATSGVAKWIKIGSSTTTNTGTVSLGNLKVVSASTGVEINGVNDSDIFWCNKQTSGVCWLSAGSASARSGEINIGNADSNSGGINIGTGTTAGGAVNILIGGSGVMTKSMNISTGITSGTVTIGSLSNGTALNGSVILAPPLTLGTVATANTQLGFRTASLITSTAFVATASFTAYDAKTFTFPAILNSVWLVELRVRSGFTSQNFVVSLTTTSATIDFAQRTLAIDNATGFNSVTLNTTVSLTALVNYYVVVRSTIASANFTDFYLFATRIG
jgi:hypothetical protein